MSHLLYPGRPGLRQSFKFLKYYHFRDATLSQKKHNLLEEDVKSVPPGDLYKHFNITAEAVQAAVESVI